MSGNYSISNLATAIGKLSPSIALVTGAPHTGRSKDASWRDILAMAINNRTLHRLELLRGEDAARRYVSAVREASTEYLSSTQGGLLLYSCFRLHMMPTTPQRHSGGTPTCMPTGVSRPANARNGSWDCSCGLWALMRALTRSLWLRFGGQGAGQSGVAACRAVTRARHETHRHT